MSLTPCGHSPIVAKGLCRACYGKAWAKANPEKVKTYSKTHYQKNPGFKKVSKRAKCHPEKPSCARGLCTTCYSRVYKGENREKVNAKNREYWEKRDKPKYKERKREYKYKISADDQAKLLASQGGVCAICKGLEDGTHNKRLELDHCHDTGKIRGFLCHSCNLIVTQRCTVNPDILLSAHRYVTGAL